MATVIPPPPPPPTAADLHARIPDAAPRRVDSDTLHDTPFATLGSDFEQFSIRWWFDYFWKEARSANSSDQQQVVAGGRQNMDRIADELFEPAPGRPGYRVRDRWSPRSAQDINDNAWREILTTLLYLGFQEMDRGQVPNPAGLPLATLPTRGIGTAHLAIQQQFDPANDIHRAIYFRSEARTVERIIRDGGTARQVDVESLARTMHFHRHWHPFSSKRIADKMWYRRGQKDNDFFTVISVAKTFRACLCFPKIDEQRLYGFPPRPIGQWTEAELDRFKASLALVSINGHEHVVVFTRVTAYECLAPRGSAIVDVTGLNPHGDPYPERGLETIPLDHIFAFFRVTRFHLGQGDPSYQFTGSSQADQFTAVVQGYGRAKDVKLAQDIYRRRLYDAAHQEYTSCRDAFPLTTAWGGADLPLRRIQELQVPLGDARLRALKQAAHAHAAVHAVVAAPALIPPGPPRAGPPAHAHH